MSSVHGGPVGVEYISPRAEAREYAKLRDHKDLITVVPRAMEEAEESPTPRINFEPYLFDSRGSEYHGST